MVSLSPDIQAKNRASVIPESECVVLEETGGELHSKGHQSWGKQPMYIFSLKMSSFRQHFQKCSKLYNHLE